MWVLKHSCGIPSMGGVEMRLAKVFFVVLMLSGCSESTVNLGPGDRVLQFIDSPDYELLSEADRSVLSRDEWGEHASSWHMLRPSLSPTSKYFELEQHLYEFVSYELKEVVGNDDESYSVAVVFRVPAVLEEVFFFSDYSIKYLEDELTNLMVAYENGRLTEASITYSEVEANFTVVPSGIFIDAEESQKRREIRAKVDQLFSDLSHIDGYDLDFAFYSRGSAKLVRQIEELRAIGLEQILLDISSLESAIIQANELQPERSNYSDLFTLSKLHQARVLLESDRIFKSSLVFEGTRVAEARGRRDLGLFFDWSLTSESLPDEAVSAGFQVRYFDSDERQVGSENVLISSINSENENRGGSVGRIIDNQGVARRAESVEVRYLVPTSAPRFNCRYDGAVKCE